MTGWGQSQRTYRRERLEVAKVAEVREKILHKGGAPVSSRHEQDSSRRKIERESRQGRGDRVDMKAGVTEPLPCQNPTQERGE
jgi:hypothetical protein